MEIPERTEPLIHIKIKQIKNGNYMKYFQEAVAATGSKYQITFTGPDISVAHPTIPVTVMHVNSDSDSDMKDLINRLKKMNEEESK